jgi:hypothetical protein
MLQAIKKTRGPLDAPEKTRQKIAKPIIISLKGYFMKNTFPLVLLLSLTAHSAVMAKTCDSTCATKKTMTNAAHKVTEDIKEGIHRTQEDIKSIEDRATYPLLTKTAEYERAEAAHSVKVAAADTAHAVKEAAKAKFQNIKSEAAQHKAESSRAQASRQVKHAAADTAEVIKKKAVAEAEVVKTTVHSTVDRAKEAYHHARAEHNKKAAQRHAKAAIEDTHIALTEEAKAIHLRQS